MMLMLLSPLLCAIFLAMASLLRKTSLEESVISRLTQITFGVYFLGTLASVFNWFLLDYQPYRWHFSPFLNLHIDTASIVYLCMTAIIANIILFYSRRYLHRDPGYQRFFMVLSLFIAGLTLIMTAGSFELLFAGWEVVGLSSFLLIGFYWHRPQAALNAGRAYYIYRVCDLGLLASAFIAHLIWHTQDVFFELSHGIWHTHWREVSLVEQWVLCLMILLPVLGKSAQFPLSYWLPRAMEGPTPSSAIFYGALSVHAGVFLLIRTFAIWYNTPGFVWVVGSIGLLTAVTATLFGRVQANIKGQIGYASIAQVGLMLIELSLGFMKIALAHMALNAFFRCFQLLISPSIVSNQLQIHHALMGKVTKRARSIHPALYLFALNEGYLPDLIRNLVVQPICTLAERINQFERHLVTRWITVPALFGSIAWLGPLPYLVLGLSLVCALIALGEKKSPFRVLHTVTLSNTLIATAIWFEHRQAGLTVLLYLCALCISWLLVRDSLKYISRKYQLETVSDFSGLFAQFPLASTCMLVGILGLIGFPISMTFWGEDRLIQDALSSGWTFLLVFNSLFILNGITLMRLYSRLSWGKREPEAIDASLDFTSIQAIGRITLFVLLNLSLALGKALVF